LVTDLAVQNYTIKLYINDQTFGIILPAIKAHFTTRGPVILENIEITSNDTIANPGDRLKYSLTMKNMGVTDSVFNVDLNLIITDTSITESTFGYPEFGDIAPGESVGSSVDFGIKFQDYCILGIYEVELEITSEGIHYWSDSFTVEVVEDPTAIEELSKLPNEYVLEQNYPNPFNPSTTIKYSIPKQSNVTLKVFDVLSRELVTLINKQQPQGNYETEFDATDLTSGIYFYKLQAGKYVETKKMILLK